MEVRLCEGLRRVIRLSRVLVSVSQAWILLAAVSQSTEPPVPACRRSTERREFKTEELVDALLALTALSYVQTPHVWCYEQNA